MTSLQKLLLFFALTYVITWTLWLTIVISGQYYLDFPAELFYLLGGFGPSAAGVILVLRTYDREARRDFWRRTWSFRLISPGWLLFIILVFPLVYLLGIGISLALGGPPPGAEQFSLLITQPILIAPVLLTSLIAGPLSEELGWRATRWMVSSAVSVSLPVTWRWLSSGGPGTCRCS
jgi:uncharacterized protein